MNFKRFWLILVFCSLFFSCKLFTKNDNYSSSQNYHTVFLNVAIQEPYSAQTAIINRSAVPDLPDISCISYEITATNNEETVISTTPISNDGKLFMLEITTGDWEIVIKGFNNSTNNISEEILYGEKNISVDDYGKYDLSIPVYYIESDFGNVNLEIDVTDSFIDKLYLKGTNTSLDGEYFKNDDGKIQIIANHIQASTYSAILSFYENLGNENNSEYTHLISIQEKINVRKNLTTDKWIKSGSTPYLQERIVSENNQSTVHTDFVLTTEIISKLVNSTFYVSSSDELQRKLNNLNNNPSDSNTGSWKDPFESIQAAVKKIYAVNQNNNSENDYTILIDGPIEINICNFSLPIENNTNNHPNITIKPYITPENETSAYIIGKNPIITTGNNFELLNDNSSFCTCTQNCNVCLSDISVSNCLFILEQNCNFTIDGNTTFQNSLIYLKNQAKIYTQNISVNSQNSSEIISKIKCENPVENETIIENKNDNLSEGIIKRFILQNPGYYLSFDEDNKKGIVKSSHISITLPKIKKGLVTITASTENDSFIEAQNGELTILSEYFNENETIIFTANVEIQDDENGQNIVLPQNNCSLTLYCGTIPVLYRQNNENSLYPNSLILEKNVLMAGKYILEITYAYEGIFYDSKVLITIE